MSSISFHPLDRHESVAQTEVGTGRNRQVKHPFHRAIAINGPTRVRVSRPARAILVALAVMIGMFAVGTGSASAATPPSWHAYPTFGCAVNSAGLEILLNEVDLNSDGQYVAVAASVYVWTNSGWTAVGPMYAESTNKTVYGFQNTAIGKLGEDRMYAYVHQHGYYAVQMLVGVQGYPTVTTAWANFSPYVMGETQGTYYSSQICKV